jgi:DNA-binding NarL/FixJ family response regulator
MTATTIETTALRVLVVDDHGTFAELLIAAIDLEPDLVSVGYAPSGCSAVAMYAELRPDVVLMDPQLPDMDGFAAAAQIVAMNPEARVVVLTAHVTATAVAAAAASGVCGFLSKDGRLGDLLKTVRTAKPGSLAVNPALVTRLFDPPRPAGRALARPLSKRELSVLVGMADGKRVSSIAHELLISSHTCRRHVKNLLSKLGARSQLEAVIVAVRIGLVQIHEETAQAAAHDFAQAGQPGPESAQPPLGLRARA